MDDASTRWPELDSVLLRRRLEEIEDLAVTCTGGGTKSVYVSNALCTVKTYLRSSWVGLCRRLSHPAKID